MSSLTRSKGLFLREGFSNRPLQGDVFIYRETWVFIASDVLAECFQVFVSHEECANQSGVMDV